MLVRGKIFASGVPLVLLWSDARHDIPDMSHSFPKEVIVILIKTASFESLPAQL